MAWRDEIARYAENGNVEGVLRIFDEINADRQRQTTLNSAYLQALGGKTTDRLEACAAAHRTLGEAFKGWKP